MYKIEENPFLEVRASSIHGLGVFVLAELSARTYCLSYRGKLLDIAALDVLGDAQKPFLFQLEEGMIMDGSGFENPARFINHSCEPNCEVDYEDGVLRIYTTRMVEAGEELTFHYQLKPLEALNHPCRCGKPSCFGYMVGKEWKAEFLKLKSRLARGSREGKKALRINKINPDA